MKGDLSDMSGEELQNTVKNIMEDPAFGKLVSEIRGGADADGAPPAMPQITPEMMAKLPQMMSALAPLVSGMNGGAGEKPGKREGGDESGKETKGNNKSEGESEKRKKLLTALRPYLSDNRREAVDNILKVTEMTDIISSLDKLKQKPQ